MMKCPIYSNLKKIIDFLLILCLYLYAVSASFPELEKSHNEGQGAERGYDCGRIFFTDEIVLDALKIVSTDEGRDNLMPYMGPLYETTMGYLTWPIALEKDSYEIKKFSRSRIWRNASYQIVFNNNIEVIDLIVRLKNYEFAKCWRVDPEAQNEGIKNTKGYYCGTKFIPKGDVEQSARFAQPHLGKNQIFPAPYNQESSLFIWPIYNAYGYVKKPNSLASPYFIVIDLAGQIKDVVAQTLEIGYVKCMLSNDALPAYVSNVQTRPNIEFPRSGFDCNGIFFDDNDLQLAREMAYRSQTTRKQVIFPVMYIGPTFDTPCLLWPVKPSGNTISFGKIPPYRLVLTLEFNVMSVVMLGSKSMKKCERKTILSETINHDQNDYQCGRTKFLHSELVAVAEIACKKRYLHRVTFPRRFEQLTFHIPGPYLMYPMIKGKKFSHSPGSYYMVMNDDCMVAGAIRIDKKTNEINRCKVIGSSN